jgi:hypothetical protein
MSYVELQQGDRQATSDTSSPELPRFSHRPLSIDFDSLPGHVNVVDQDRTSHATPSSATVGNLLKSLTSSAPSYDMVEDDDYDEPPKTPKKESLTQHETATSEQPPVRTASVSRHLPLNHPTPDLQSLQGAYLKNVERLEESAERLSMTSSLDEPLQNTEQRPLPRRASAASNTSSRYGGRRRELSTTSLSNSIIGVNSTARTGGYSPSAYITSPTGSIRSGPNVQARISRSSRLAPQPAELETDGRPSEAVRESSLKRRPSGDGEYHASGALAPADIPQDQDRPPSAASGDTFQQADNAFADFDGEHYSIDRDSSGSLRRQLPLAHPPRARDSRAFREAQPGESMIYYPAPVPVMLNLPTRLSRTNFAQSEKRRTQALSGIPDEMRKSAAWLAGEAPPPPTSPPLNNKRASVLPPQLRASAFFDQPGVSPNLQLKNGSAVQTLDSILDAAAHAPVSAFTDHPIVGKLGKEVYGREKSARKSTQIDAETMNLKKRHSSLSGLLGRRKSSGHLEGARMSSRESKLMDADATSGDELDAAEQPSLTPGADELPTPLEGEHEEDRNSDTSSVHQPGYSGAPTTLLAELQLRKAQQKQRNRTAADAFPNGMHSTLLEMDAVMQLQQKSRKQKHVTLAWEDLDAADRENFDDEDVPLGVLFPEKDRAAHVNANRPIGLMERREMEDNEPLSHRRARLRGEPVQVPVPSTITPPRSDAGVETESKLRLEIPGMDAEVEEQEEETLAQRRQRMKQEKEKGISGGFASDVASTLGLDAVVKEMAPSKTPDAEETLGQRRKRLQDEAKSGAAGSRPPLKPAHSMADLLMHHPVGMGMGTGMRLPSGGALPRYSTFGPGAGQQHMPSVPAHLATLPYYNHAPYMQPGYGAGQGMVPGGMTVGMGMAGQPATPLSANPTAFMMPDPSGPPLNSQQRAVIDRWRQGIME